MNIFLNVVFSLIAICFLGKSLDDKIPADVRIKYIPATVTMAVIIFLFNYLIVSR